MVADVLVGVAPVHRVPVAGALMRDGRRGGGGGPGLAAQDAGAGAIGRDRDHLDITDTEVADTAAAVIDVIEGILDPDHCPESLLCRQ